MYILMDIQNLKSSHAFLGASKLSFCRSDSTQNGNISSRSSGCVNSQQESLVNTDSHRCSKRKHQYASTSHKNYNAHRNGHTCHHHSNSDRHGAQSKQIRVSNRNAVFRRQNSSQESAKMIGHSKTDSKGEPISKALCDKNPIAKRYVANHKRKRHDAHNYCSHIKYNRISSVNEDDARKHKKTRRSRRRKRHRDDSGPKKRMRWTESDVNEVSRLHLKCVQNGQPLAPYNTTQFIMNEHNAEKEIDFDKLSGQIQQMQNKQRPGLSASDCDDSVVDEYNYSSPEDESYFLEQQFNETYDTIHAERLNSLPKGELLKEYLVMEKELELLKEKMPSKSCRGGKMEFQTKGETLNNGKNCCINRNLFKENKRLRKLLKQVYNRYNSVMCCINYVNSTGTSSQASDNFYKSEEFNLSTDTQYRIEKYINQDSSTSSSHESSTTSCSSGSTYTSTTMSSEDDGMVDEEDEPSDEEHQEDICGYVSLLLKELVDQVSQSQSQLMPTVHY